MTLGLYPSFIKLVSFVHNDDINILSVLNDCVFGHTLG